MNARISFAVMMPNTHTVCAFVNILVAPTLVRIMSHLDSILIHSQMLPKQQSTQFLKRASLSSL